MTTEVIAPLETKSESLFNGLQAYTEDQADMFFGRDEEIKTLYRLIKANTLTIVFGKSGTGKTSLLNAGVFPKLREIYCLPFRIRLEFLDTSPDLLTQIKQVLKTEIDKYEFHVESYPTTETLWEYFHKEPLWKIVTPVLIFDQFEEIFTLANKSSRFKNQELDLLIEELSDLIENSIPDKLQTEFIDGNKELDFEYDKQKAKILFSFREDFLAEIESITIKIPSVKNSRFRLKPMHGQQAYEVITKTWKKAIDPAEAHKIVYFLTTETETDSIDAETKYGKYDIIEVEPSLLSQVCDFIEQERIKEGSNKISADFLQQHPKDQILRAIYDKALSDSNAVIALNNGKNESDRNELKEFIEDHLITDEGYRTKYALKEINYKIRPGIELLEKKYLLREEGSSVELTHDVIVTLVKSDREERRKNLALARERKKAKRKMRLIVALVFLLVMTVGAYAYYNITKKANHDKEEAIKETKKIEVKNAFLRSDSSNLKHSIDSLLAKKEAVLSKHGDTTKTKMLSDSINNLNNEISALHNHYVVYNDSITTLVNTIVKFKNNEKELRDLYDNIKSERDDLSVQNNQLKSQPGSKKGFENIEKGYVSKINSLEQRIGILQKSRDSLAAIVTNMLKQQYQDVTIDPITKKKIFGYGYDYHPLRAAKKN